MTDEAKISLALGGYVLGLTASVGGIAALIDMNNNSKIYFEDIKKSSIVITDDNNGIQYHLAQKNFDNKSDKKYIDILLDQSINNSSIKYIGEAAPYFTPLYEKQSFYYKSDLQDLVDNVCSKNEYVTSNGKVKVMFK